MLFALWISGVGGPHGQMSESQQEGLGKGRAGIGRVGRGGEAWRGRGRGRSNCGRGNGAGARCRGENPGDDPLEGGEEGGRPLSPSIRCPFQGGPDDIYRREWVHKSDSGFPRDSWSGGGSRDWDQRGRDQNADADRFEGTRTMQQNTLGEELERVQRLALLASQMLQQSQQPGAAGALQSSAVDFGGSSTMVDNGLLCTALHTGGTNWPNLIQSQSRSAVAPRLPGLQGLQDLQTASNFSLPLNRGDVAPLSCHPAAVAAAATVSAPFSASSNYALSAR